MIIIKLRREVILFRCIRARCLMIWIHHLLHHPHLRRHPLNWINIPLILTLVFICLVFSILPNTQFERFIVMAAWILLITWSSTRKFCISLKISRNEKWSRGWDRWWNMIASFRYKWDQNQSPICISYLYLRYLKLLSFWVVEFSLIMSLINKYRRWWER